uniref:PUA domain-containing protein n=1 Tax=Kalanchoe fedtschenkoi TaxID=63787 RepID=A0A7N0UP57_KALFE
MRPLDEAETTAVFEKLFKFIPNNLKNIVENPSHEGPDKQPGRYCFRLRKNKVYYAANPCWSASGPASASSPKPTSEMSFLYGNHVLNGGLGRIMEGIAAGDGVVVFSMADVALGFGIAAKSTGDCRKMDPNGIVVLHQADAGEYLRMEDEL